MSLVQLDGMPMLPVGMVHRQFNPALGNLTVTTQDATLESCHMIGRFFWADGGSHTVDTSGSSSMGWRAGTVTFANGGSTFTVGMATVDTATGPPARATNVADLITFSVSAVLTGGGGGVTLNTWNEMVPTAGTMTIATGDVVAFCTQMTVKAGADTITTASYTQISSFRPCVTNFISAAYTDSSRGPNCVITASDGTLGWFAGSIVGTSSAANTTYGSGSSPNEYGNYLSFAFPTKVYGIYVLANPAADFDAILYSDPLGTPAAQRTASIDSNVVTSTGISAGILWFSSPYTTTANQPLAVAALPTTASTIQMQSISLSSATHQAVYGANGYAVSRSSGGGAFAAVNSSKDRFGIGLLIGAFDDGAGGGGGGGLRLAGGGGLASGS